MFVFELIDSVLSQASDHLHNIKPLGHKIITYAPVIGQPASDDGIRQQWLDGEICADG